MYIITKKAIYIHVKYLIIQEGIFISTANYVDLFMF